MPREGSVVRVYIAGPYSLGDVGANVATAMRVWHELWGKGYIPFCPHLSHFLHMHQQLHYEEWMRYDHSWLGVCNCVLRIQGVSHGADRECLAAAKMGIPVFTSIKDLDAWAESIRPGTTS